MTAGLVSAVLLALLVALAIPAVLPDVLPGVRGALPWFPGRAACAATTVEVVAPPSVRAVVDIVVAPLQGRQLDDGTCVDVRVRAQEPAETVTSSDVLPPAQAPQVWISDSTIWSAQLTRWKTQQVGSLGTSPVVLTSSASAVQRLGWIGQPPGWAQAMDGTHPLATGALPSNAAAELAMVALWQSAGKGLLAQQAVAAAVLAAGRTRTIDGQTPIQVASSNAANAPLIVSSELDMISSNRDAPAANLAAVYPREGTPFLDFPVLRVSPQLQDQAHSAATDVVVTALSSDDARIAARTAGLRDAVGGAIAAAGHPIAGVAAASAVKRLAAPTTAELTGFLKQLAVVAAPSRILAVVDVSLSMRTIVPGSGLSRVELAGRAATAAGELLTDASSAGLWVFAVKMDGDKPYRELAPVAPLGSPDGSGTHRDSLNARLGALADQMTGGGTGLYESALAAIRAQRATFDPRSVNTVVLFTDGTNENSPRISLNQLVESLTLDAAAAPDRPVGLVAIGMGPTADLVSLRAMAAPTGGAAYRADTPAQLQRVLYDALARRG
jgi:Ca-activated chloride channel family protein